MNATDYAVLEAIHVSWAGNDLRATVRCFAEDIEFAVNAPDGSASFVGTGRGRDTLRNRLSDFLDKYEVLAFTPLQITKRDDGLACRVQYHYRHRQTGMEIDGSMRLLWSIAGDKATSLKVIHDAVRMGVFFEMADRCSRGDLYM
ncbi:MAG TPA: nuclear transport factor 2 family protein [Hyphomicrobiaceae bacterium]|jgi:ketosteroid isomerase-like protein|nr:nuclear transport factor 2 family protein [Hyphomicrobiaceae bacterium]